MRMKIDLPIEIKLPVGKFGGLEEIEEDLDDLDDDFDFEEEEIINNHHLITLEDIKRIKEPSSLAKLLNNLGYPTLCQAINIEDYSLQNTNQFPIKNGYLLADCNHNSSSLQVLLFVLEKENFASEATIRLRMRSISAKVCQQASEYLLFATVNFRQLYVASPQRGFDKKWNVKVETETLFIDITNPDFYDRNWLEKLALKDSLKSLNQTKHQVLRNANKVRASQTKKEHFTEDSIRLYFQEISRIRLLRADEEIELSRKIQDLMYLEQMREEIADECDFHPDDVREVDWAIKMGMPLGEFRKRLHSGRRAKDKMIQSNLRLVVSIAKKYINRGLDFQDLIQEGSLGLIRAAEKFDCRKGYKFSTYATWWIRQAITRGISDQSRTIRLPVHLYETIGRIKKTIKLLSQEMERKPTEEEIAIRMEMTVEKLRFIAQSSQPCISLFTPINKQGEDCICDLIEFENDTPEEIVTMILLREDLEFVLSTISPRERDVLRLRFGLDNGRDKTLEEIGQIFNVTRERIRQIQNEGLRKLRHPNRTSGMREYIH